jgi:16S rRNA (uracil1498-N3)-methyltransferase
MSDLRRFFVDKITAPLIIEGEEFRHAVSVLRIKEGDEIIVCDNSGYEYISTVSKINKKDLELEVINKRLSDTEPKTEVTLIIGYLKGDKTELVVQKAVELGVKNIVVFNSKYCSAYMNDNKLSRLNRVSVEASKQCGRAVAPSVEYAPDFESALEFGASAKNKLFACEFGGENRADLSSLEGSTAIVVGSEGGFSVDERDLAINKGYKVVYLGKRILRAETAAIALSAIVMHTLKEFE